jgi:membrane protein DedA with SNARE-associated domain
MFVEAVGNSLATSTTQVWEGLIRSYGYLALVVGAFLEGETVVVLGGFSAQRGYLLLAGVMLAVFLGAIAGDWLFFYLGRAERHLILDKKPEWKEKVDHVNEMLLKHRDGLIIARRFFYGLRNLTAFVIGMSPIPIRKFLFLNLISAVLWAIGYGVLGYLFGGTLERFFGNVREYEIHILLTFLLVMLTIGFLQIFRLRKKAKKLEG